MLHELLLYFHCTPPGAVLYAFFVGVRQKLGTLQSTVATGSLSGAEGCMRADTTSLVQQALVRVAVACQADHTIPGQRPAHISTVAHH